MSLRLQINLIVGALALLFLSAVMWLQLRGMRESVLEEVVAAHRVAAQMLNRTAWRYAAQGTPSMLGFLQGIGRVRSNDISFFDREGRELYRSPPPTYKAGRDAPAWFARHLTPELPVQSIEFPDGRLVVRVNASRAVLDAWDDAVVLTGVGLALLVAVHAAVFWLVGRAVRPFGRIVAALDEVRAGRFDARLPPLPGTEAAAIGSAFNHMAGQLGTHLETERRALRAELQLSNSRELTRWIEQQIERERRMIARELHDELGQSVTAMRSMALSIAQRLQAHDAPTAATARLIADESSRLYDAMHGMIPRLVPLVLDNFGLAEALRDLAGRVRASHPQAQVELDVDLGAAQLDGDTALALYRAAQEGVSNALRHGAATSLQLSVRAEAGMLLLSLRDDGRGLGASPASPDGHYGLRWLTERVEALGGSLRLSPAEPRGMRLEVRVPVPVPAVLETA